MSVPRGVALLVAGAFFMEILDATIITPAIPLISASFGVDAVDVNIAISAYLVTVAVLIPVSGWMSDRFGTRYADLVFAKDALAEHCRLESIPFRPFADFDDVRRELDANGSVPGPWGGEPCPGWREPS